MPVSKLLTVEKLYHLGVSAHGEGCVICHRGARHVAASSGHENDSVRTLDSVDGGRRSILKYGYVGDFAWVEIREIPFHAVDQHQRSGSPRSAYASNVNLGLVFSRNAGSLPADKSGELSSQHIAHIVSRSRGEFLSVYRGDGTGKGTFFLYAIAHYHRFVQKRGVVFQRHVEMTLGTHRLFGVLISHQSKEKYRIC